jgi:hypothetical protein
MKTKKFFHQNDQRKKLYKNRYKRKFLEYPCYSFMCKNKKDQAFLGPHCMKKTIKFVALYGSKVFGTYE